ncbi:hypothetical protein [Streptomyces sp. NBC_00083]|uniref:hypothetical protein n=1 Tax=Streptomyces sp. NBC_00083 TaxID=2975647 RepID=UPI0022535B74|nr:hypothetical protein [Streptomyces sp. NBC_00083]MCX5384933.1 hypothetical protein [Streptomyces sp. NBC_00083]
MRAISGSIASASGRADLSAVPRIHRAAAFIALAWAVVLLAWTAYNCFWQVGFADFARGIVYYGVGDGSGQADTANLNWAVVYAAAGLFILRGSIWARGLACGAALIEGYNRLRSLTGALFDDRQHEWFTHTTEGQLKLVTFALGFLVAVALVLLLVRDAVVYEPWTPPANPWAQQGASAPHQQQGFPQQAQPGYVQPTYQAPPAQAQQPYQAPAQAQPPYQAPQGQQPSPYSYGYPQQPGTPHPGQQPPMPGN